jgi:hypothetical protein
MNIDRSHRESRFEMGPTLCHCDIAVTPTRAGHTSVRLHSGAPPHTFASRSMIDACCVDCSGCPGSDNANALAAAPVANGASFFHRVKNEAGVGAKTLAGWASRVLARLSARARTRVRCPAFALD